MENIDAHIAKDKEILDDPVTSPQARRHTQQELDSLQSYKVNHPEDDHDPTPFELYCNDNPDASECRVYDT